MPDRVTVLAADRLAAFEEGHRQGAMDAVSAARSWRLWARDHRPVTLPRASDRELRLAWLDGYAEGFAMKVRDFKRHEEDRP